MTRPVGSRRLFLGGRQEREKGEAGKRRNSDVAAPDPTKKPGVRPVKGKTRNSSAARPGQQGGLKMGES
jgi:hypothetical protein